VIDVIIPNYNGAALLPTCLDALAVQSRQDFLITVVDDGSTDSSLTLLATDYPHVHVLPQLHNRGLAAVVNRGLQATNGDIVVLLNNDTEAHPHWLANLVGTLERYPAYAFAASKLLLFDRRDTIHSTGDFYRTDGIPGSRGVWQTDHGQYDAVMPIFGPCAAAAAYRRSVLEVLSVEHNVFDEDLVMYCEDVDLNLRAYLHNYRTLFVPNAIVYHQLSATGGGTLASYFCGRNFPLVWVKNMPPSLMRRFWPHFLLAQAKFTFHSLWHIREPAARARLKGQFAALHALPRFLRKRGTMSGCS
jgi:GT2 family glycosyltransferase